MTTRCPRLDLRLMEPYDGLAWMDDPTRAAAGDAESSGRIEEIRYVGGEAANRWAQVVTTGLRPRDLKRIFERCGIEANRIIRTRFGPVTMDRPLAMRSDAFCRNSLARRSDCA